MLRLQAAMESAIKNKKKILWEGGNNNLVREMTKVMLDFPETPEGFTADIEIPPLHKKVILVSGGMDSTIMWWLNREEEDKIALYVKLGQSYNKKEFDVITKMGIKPLEVVTHPLDFGENWKHIIPTRNFLLIALAERMVAHEGEIWIGAVQGESAHDKGDKSELFFRMVEEFIWRTKNKKVFIKDLKEHTKNDWLKIYMDATHDESILDTITCFDAGDKPCGRCQGCVRKWIAMRYCGLDTKGFFQIDPYVGGREYIQKYKTKLKDALDRKDFTHYSEDRAKQDLKVILNYEMHK